jgi:hypothetical protein
MILKFLFVVNVLVVFFLALRDLAEAARHRRTRRAFPKQ